MFKLVAFYLPQYHRIPENDKFWGEGFTEWKFVAKARPLFRHHYQPRIPSELGFYDLRFTEVLEEQVKLAKDYGIDAFCFYFYWFNGKKILYKPIENFVMNKNINFQYCLCWANENWTRRWDGEEHYILLKQEYHLHDLMNLIKEFINHFRDERYLRYEGKPILLVYRIADIPVWREISYIWREECYKAGIGDIHIAGVWGVKNVVFSDPPTLYGLDSYVVFPPHASRSTRAEDKVLDLHKNFCGTIYDYDEVISHDLDRFRGGYEFHFHRGIMLGWDNTPRVNLSSRIFIGFTPLRFAHWLRNIMKQELIMKTKERLIFINAWNEWGEGTYLEPDERYGKTTLRLVKLIKNELEKLESSYSDLLLLYKSKLVTDKNGNITKLEVKSPYYTIEGKFIPNENRINILFVAHSVGKNLFGGERSFIDLLKIITSLEKFNIYIALNSDKNKDYINKLSEYACKIFIVNYKQWMGGRAIEPGIVLEFADIIATYKIDIVYVNTIVLCEPSIAAKRMKRLSITHVREIISNDHYLSFEIGLKPEEIKEQIYSRSDIIICNSKSTYEEYCDFDNKFVIPNIVESSYSHHENLINFQKNNDKVIFGMISSNHPKKGLLNLVELVEYLRDYSEKLELWIVGPKNPFVDYLERSFRKSETNFVKFIDYTENPREIIEKIDVVVSLSDFAESFGRTIAEAMALGKPVIAFARGAMKELIKHNENGFLVDYKDIKAFADYCKKLTDSPELREKMGKNSRRLVEKYSFNSVKAIAEDVMNRIINSTNLNPENARTKEVKTTIIIPIFNAPYEVKNCLHSLFMYTPLKNNTEVLIINDGSTHPLINEILNSIEEVKPNISIIHNKRNLGYTKSINLGIKISEPNDVILLNSDTILTPYWLEGLRAAAYSDSKIGTVTAMSDNAGYFSFPIPNKKNPKPSSVSYEEYALRIIENTLDLDPVEVPTGNGFCMYIKRELINQIGLFDEDNFPVGYGEENDFCLRALMNGWKNVISPWSFVFHIKSASFGSARREELVKRGLDIINRKYPNYKELVDKYFNSEEMKKLRERVKLVYDFYTLYERLLNCG